MDFDRRDFLIASAVAATASPHLLMAAGQTALRPEDFGARGDGVTNDTAAFSRLSAEVNRRGGGTISLRAARTYIVGAQSLGNPGGFGWNPAPILDLRQLSAPLTIIGNGARLRCQPGLRFGTFDRTSGQAVDRPRGQRDKNEIASPYIGMISATKCSAPVTIRDVELDGNAERLSIGGKFGDKGHQIPATGLYLTANTSTERVANVYSHHHALDGAIFKGTPARSGPRSTISGLRCTNNARQGVSIVSGNGFDFSDCDFSHTARLSFSSPPRAGVDIESEGGRPIRDVSFLRCKFTDNGGAGLTAESGDCEDLRFADCLLIGTTNWSAWPRKPRMAFTGCTFVGAVVHAFGDPDPARAARFVRCRFTDNPALSPQGVYTGPKGGGGPIVDAPQGFNVLFDGCSFELIGDATLPLTRDAIFKDCKMSQRSPRPGRPTGRFLGVTTISGPVNLAGSTVEGSLVVNGRQIPRGQLSPR